jgi:hypothetical protein
VIKDVRHVKENEESLQLGLFDYEKVVMLDRLKALDVMNMTPMEALKILHELSIEAKELN